MKKIKDFYRDVRKELKKVRWPSKKEMATYSAASLSLIVLFACFFSLTDFVLASIKVLIGG